MESVDEILARRGGWATASELVGMVTRHAVAKAVARGDIQRISLGIYALPGLPAETVAVLAYDGVLRTQARRLYPAFLCWWRRRSRT